MSKRRRSMFGKSGGDSGEDRPNDDEQGPFTVPDEFGDAEELPPDEGTEERIRKALEGDVVEVSETVSSHNFVRAAVDDTGDDSWDNSIHANRRADGSVARDEPEAEAVVEPVVKADIAVEPAGNVPDFFAMGSVDSNNPISFVGDVLGGSGESEPEPVVAFGDELESDDEPLGFLGGADGAPTPLEATGEAFFGGAPQPPTEEVPSAILEDLTQPSSIPSMSGGVGYEEVLEPTIQEEVIGAPTPAPVLRSDEPPPPDLRKRLAAKAKETYAEADDDDDDFRLPIVPLALLGVLLLVAAGAVFGIARLVMGPDLEQAEQAAISVEVKPPAEIPMAALPDVMRPGDPRDIPVGGEVDPMERPVAAPEVEAGSGAAARPAPRRAAPSKKAAPEPEVGLQSKITVTSNRRVLVHLDGQPQGYAPLEIMVGAGTYTVSAALPGRGETEQTKTVEVGRKSIQRVGFIF